ncbi:MAG: mechanosensitive ion channel [Bradymonadaceae bacterium]|nr:mechanosensitive ion channel [Lujinxingiaceae bacterium]
MTDPSLTASHPTYVILLLLVLAVLITRFLALLGRMEGAHRLRRWLPLLFVVVWTTVLATSALAFASDGLQMQLVLVLFFLTVAVAASLGWLRSLVAGIVLIWEQRIHIGDSIRAGDVQGEVVAIGMRSVRVRDPDGVLHELPHELLMNQPLATHSRSGEVVCDIAFVIPNSINPERALELAREAASLTPLASPRHRPEAFMLDESGPGQPIRCSVRGYAFSPQYRDHYRSDVLARLHLALRPLEAEIQSNIALIEE